MSGEHFCGLSNRPLPKKLCDVAVANAKCIKLDCECEEKVEALLTTNMGTMVLPLRMTETPSVYSHYQHYNTEIDLQRMSSIDEELNMCGFYYPGLNSQHAKLLLKPASVGTFLVRDSSDPKYLYSLSLKTDRGTTSVRIEYSHGCFRLDSEEQLRRKMPKFTSVIKLINHYVKMSKSETSKDCRWLESSGRRDVTVKLTKPRIGSVCSLQHMCRLTINSVTPTDKVKELSLPSRLAKFIMDYPYSR